MSAFPPRSSEKDAKVRENASLPSPERREIIIIAPSTLISSPPPPPPPRLPHSRIRSCCFHGKETRYARLRPLNGELFLYYTYNFAQTYVHVYSRSTCTYERGRKNTRKKVEQAFSKQSKLLVLCNAASVSFGDTKKKFTREILLPGTTCI